MLSVYLITWSVHPILRPHYRKSLLDTMLGWRSAQEIWSWCVALVCRCVCFCFSVCRVGNFSLPLKYKVQMSGKTEVNCGSFPSRHFERYRPAVKFSREYTVHSHATTSCTTQNGSKAELASTAVTANGVCFPAWRTIIVITSSYVWPNRLTWTENGCNLHEKCIPEFPTLN